MFNNSRISSRKAAQQLDISKYKYRTLHDDHRHAYHLQPAQDLHLSGKGRRMRIGRLLHKIR